MKYDAANSYISCPMKKLLLKVFIGVFVLAVIASVYLFVGTVLRANNIVWGANFSAKHAASLGLDWKVVYTNLLDELQIKRIKVSLDWNDLEPQKDEFSFEDADWQVEEAKKRDVKLIVVVGMKTMRWPECHIPEWAKNLSKQEQQKEVLELLREVVERYKDSQAVVGWQVENEPLLRFGDCPWRDRKFLEREVELVKSLDSAHPVIVSDSGELSLWIQAGRIGDIVSSTMYRKVWFSEFNRYVEYPLPATFYGRKANIIQKLFGVEVIGGELQAEPWGPGKLLYDTTIEEQDMAFDLAQFRKNVTFAKQTGLQEFYLWGAEWWYWRKQEASDPSFWNEAKKIFKEL
jgi:hypothetical protein